MLCLHMSNINLMEHVCHDKDGNYFDVILETGLKIWQIYIYINRFRAYEYHCIFQYI
jgi:hypothetical protein